MKRCLLLTGLVLGISLLVSEPVSSCSLCKMQGQLAPTLREEASQPPARLILFGSLENPESNKLQTNLHISNIFRTDPILADRKVVTLSRYIPVTDAKNPPRFLIFFDVFMNRLDDYRGVPIKSADGVEYVKKILAMDARDPLANLQFYFRFLDHPDKELANDAFMEFAKSTDVIVGQVAGKLPVERIRTWVRDPATPSEKLGLYAFLLGAGGTSQDAALLQTMLADTSERVSGAHDGMLSGLMNLKPREGWDLVNSILSDGKRNLQQRLAAVRAVRFYQGWQPEKYRAQVLKALEIMIVQGELADMAIEDLRKWKMWDRTRAVLGVYGKKGYESPILKDAIIRYALSCPGDSDTARFLEERRKEDLERVKDIEESLRR